LAVFEIKDLECRGLGIGNHKPKSLRGARSAGAMFAGAVRIAGGAGHSAKNHRDSKKSAHRNPCKQDRRCNVIT
jgi:hypothetical protein